MCDFFFFFDSFKSKAFTDCFRIYMRQGLLEALQRGSGGTQQPDDVSGPRPPDLTPGLGTSVCPWCDPKTEKKKLLLAVGDRGEVLNQNMSSHPLHGLFPSREVFLCVVVVVVVVVCLFLRPRP